MTEPDDLSPKTILTTAIGGAALTVVLAWCSWWLADSPGSDFPQWLAAWATVFGVAAAIVAGFYAARAFRLEFRREQRWEATQRAAQASLVGAWPGTLGFAVLADTEGQQFIPHRATAMLRNASQLPISDIEVDFVMIRKAVDFTTAESISLGKERIVTLAPDAEPIELKSASVDLRQRTHIFNAFEVEHADLRVRITFRDAANQRWLRDTDGQLAFIDQGPR